MSYSCTEPVDRQLVQRHLGAIEEPDALGFEALLLLGLHLAGDGTAHDELLAGQIAHDLDQYEDSIGYFEKSLKAKPNNIEALNYYGVALKSVGRLEDARNTFIKALEVQPRAIGTYSNLVDLEKFAPDNPLFQTMERIVQRVKNPESPPYMALHFALGKAYDDMGEYQKAFHHYSVGARLKRKTLTYNEAEVAQFFDDTRRIFTKEFITRVSSKN